MNIKKLIIGKVSSISGYPTQIFDEKNNHIADVNVRSWGRMQYMEDGDQLHHQLSIWVSEAINEKLERAATEEILLCKCSKPKPRFTVHGIPKTCKDCFKYIR